MRIISPFHDYYDSVQKQGQDRTLIYLRQPREIVLKGRTTPFPFTTKLRHFGSDIVDGCNVIGFCGRVVPVLTIHHPSQWTITPVLCYSVADVDAFVETHFKKFLVERYYAAKRRSYWSERWRYTSHKMLEEFFDECAAQQNQYEHLFCENRCPVFVYRECRAGHILTYNGCLKDMQFYRLVDSYTAFQEIQMYLGGIASPEKPIPQIDDKTLAAAKGFNKWSFRKEPTK
jgi:hypothetical protein